MYRYINLFEGSFLDKKTGKQVNYKRLNLLNEEGKILSLRVSPDFLLSEKVEMGAKVEPKIFVDSYGNARVRSLEVVK